MRRRREALLSDHTHPELATKDQYAELKADVAEVRGTVRLMVWVMGAGFTALLALYGALIAILQND
ncbi:MAG: HalX domain-containing protein [Chloroflexi bacterium]|nr:HalX domain-containing protein [Chloroflexota bacterium]